MYNTNCFIIFSESRVLHAEEKLPEIAGAGVDVRLNTWPIETQRQCVSPVDLSVTLQDSHH